MTTHFPLVPLVPAGLAVFAAGLVAAAAHAADPVASNVGSSIGGLTFAEYAGSARLGQGLVNDGVLYFIDERVGPLGKSWYVFFDPPGTSSVSATLTFDAPIVAVFGSRAQLDGSNPDYGAAGVGYGTSLFVGLEPGQDSVSVAGGVLRLSWNATDPGDHIRVITSMVPQPGTQALFGAGLLALGWAMRRRPGPGRRIIDRR